MSFEHSNKPLGSIKYGISKINNYLCEISGSYNGEIEDDRLLEYGNVQFHRPDYGDSTPL
jgi:hypothetical protein